jgi:hypothetical protein
MKSKVMIASTLSPKMNPSSNELLKYLLTKNRKKKTKKYYFY